MEASARLIELDGMEDQGRAKRHRHSNARVGRLGAGRRCCRVGLRLVGVALFFFLGVWSNVVYVDALVACGGS